MWNGNGHMGWMPFGWMLGVVLVVAIVWVLLRSKRGPPNGRDSPRDILQRRFAKGEIDGETYKRTLADLED
ncbi:MAG: SHOCT domain-containing protein [Myxococcales bacterium]|nr:SHOCT domain-containing protein [Myxococcales bacterium]